MLFLLYEAIHGCRGIVNTVRASGYSSSEFKPPFVYASVVVSSLMCHTRTLTHHKDSLKEQSNLLYSFERVIKCGLLSAGLLHKEPQ